MKNKTKEKKMSSTDYAIAVIFTLSFTAIIYIAWMIFADNFKETSYAYADSYSEQSNMHNNEIKTINSNISKIQTIDLNIDKIIDENTKNTKKEEIIVEKKDLEYTTKYTNDVNLPKGMIQVLQDGIDGEQEIYTKKTYDGDKIVKEEKIGSKIIKSSINKLVVVGIGAYVSNYQVKVGDNLYVTTSLLAVRIEPNENANKLISINKDSKVKLLKIKDKWYNVQYQNYEGWAKAECFTYLQPNIKQEQGEIVGGYTKQQLLNKLSFNMKLNEPSGITLEQFKNIFANEVKDTKKIFKNNSQYFSYVEKQYGVNGVFIAAVAIHESGWGNSKIASDKNNLFGYGAYDRNPYNSAYSFSDYSEGIDLIARIFVKYYLNPKGTNIYDGNKAVGTYYNGPTLSGVNTKYATDKNWANAVYYWMKYLYNKI